MAFSHILYMSFGKRLAEARSDLGWSQAALAEKFHKSQSTVAKWENGTRTPQDVLDRGLFYAEILGVSPVWLLQGTGPKKVSTEMSRNLRYFKMLESLAKEDREAFFQMIERVYEKGQEPLGPGSAT